MLLTDVISLYSESDVVVGTLWPAERLLSGDPNDHQPYVIS
jgi:hypothetical protein